MLALPFLIFPGTCLMLVVCKSYKNLRHACKCLRSMFRCPWRFTRKKVLVEDMRLNSHKINLFCTDRILASRRYVSRLNLLDFIVLLWIWYRRPCFFYLHALQVAQSHSKSSLFAVKRQCQLQAQPPLSHQQSSAVSVEKL